MDLAVENKKFIHLSTIQIEQCGSVTRHGSIQFALLAPGAATHTHTESPITHVSPIALPDIGNLSVDSTFPLSRAATSSPYGIITDRSSPMRHSGRRIS